LYIIPLYHKHCDTHSQNLIGKVFVIDKRIIPNCFCQQQIDVFPSKAGYWLQRPGRTERHPNSYWEDVNNRKQFFLELARNEGFDPQKPENWASLTAKQIVNHGVHTFSSSAIPSTN